MEGKLTFTRDLVKGDMIRFLGDSGRVLTVVTASQGAGQSVVRLSNGTTITSRSHLYVRKVR